MIPRSWIVPFLTGAVTGIVIARLSRSVDLPNATKDIVKDKRKNTQASTQGEKKLNSNVSSNLSSPAPSDSQSLKGDISSTNEINEKKSKVSNTSTSTSTNEGELMDSVDLDQRLLRKAEAVIQWRTNRLVLVVERCTNDHNYSAILRTAEALGIQTVYMIDPPDVVDDPLQALDDQNSTLDQQKRRKLLKSSPEEMEARRQHHLFARKATEWLTVKDFESSEACVEDLRSLGYELWVTDLSQEAHCLTATTPKIPNKVALVMGTEAVGCSQYMLDEADKRVYLPLRGFADSLNLSVATALILHQLFLMDPTLVGSLSSVEKRELRQAWFGKLCQQRLLTPSQRKTRTKLQNLIKKCQSIHDRNEENLNNPNVNNRRPLQPGEQQKLDEWPTYQEQLDELEAKLDPEKVQAAIQEWVDNPPTPLSDVRRADEHRVCYVGKNTKTHHKDHWKDMAATSNATSIYMSSAGAFREKVQEVESKSS